MTRRDLISACTAFAGTLALGHRATAQTAAPSGPFTLPPLGYSFDALEPHIDAKTMEIHHDRHHKTYVDNLNKAVASHADLQKMSVDELLGKLDSLPKDIQTAVRNNGGGHSNHSLFWKSLSKSGGKEPKGELAKDIDKAFGSFSSLQEKLSAAAVGQFGSGWGWLVHDKNGLSVVGLPNQDSPLLKGMHPVFGIDVWEHAYYLKYQNRRADYVKAIWNVWNWDFITENYASVKKQS